MSAIQFNTTQFDKKHLRSLATRRKKLQALYNAFYNQVAVIGATTGFNDPDKEFFLRDYPAAQQAIQALLQQLCRDITTNIKEGNAAAWSASNAKNSALIAALGVQKATADTLLTRVTKRSESAFNAFQGRKVNGMGLSERVWALQKGVMPQIEMALELGLAQGKSAAVLSRDVRSYLNEPNRLFRRVRGKDGILRLSKAAAAYHPGQGVYRSSYKNALRMTVTENNMAYRSADHAQWGGMDFVIGIEISLSGNHPVVDICDELKGKYPKEFKFTGWHPFCRCFATPILPSREEMNKWARMSDAERAGYRFNGEVNAMPKNFTDWMLDDRNFMRLIRAKSIPYFIKDNFVKGGWYADTRKELERGLRWAQGKPAEIKKPTALEIAEKRHAARTKEQIEDTWKRWNLNRLNNYGVSHNSISRAIDEYGVTSATWDEWLKRPHKTIVSTNIYGETERRLNGFKAVRKYYSDKRFEVETLFINNQNTAYRISKDAATMGVRGKELIRLADEIRAIGKLDGKYILGTSAETNAKVAHLKSEMQKAISERDAVRAAWEKRRLSRMPQKPSALTSINAEIGKNVSRLEVQMADKMRTDADIIADVAGADKTRGSCSSLAFAFIGNKGGMIVHDFRDGISRQTFARNYYIEKIVKACGGDVIEEFNDFKGSKIALQSMVEGKIYYFATGQHAAVLRKTAAGFEYLEQQSSRVNGWKQLNDTELRCRFGAKKSHTTYGIKYKDKTYIIDGDLLLADSGFKEMLGYINTEVTKQVKGAGGSIK